MGPRPFPILCALAILLCAPSLGTRDLWNPDEPRYAEVAREMRVSGEYLVPHLNGEVYTQKPPLFFWASAGFQALGFPFVGGRIVTGLCALVALLATFGIGRRLLGERAALLGACVLATTELFAWIGRFGVLDVPLTACTTLAVYGLVAGGRRLVLLYVGLGLAVLVKGPVGLVIPALAALALRIARPGPPRGWRHLAWGLPLTLAIVAAWLVPACLRGGEAYANAILFKQNVGRMVESWSHERPFWYYVPHLAGGFFPWTFLLPVAAVWAWRRRATDPAVKACALWFVLGFLFFSAVSGKRERYLLPLYPALALVVGRYVEEAAGVWYRRSAFVANLCVGGIGAGFVLFALFGGFLLDLEALDMPAVREAFTDLLTVPGRAALIAAGLALATLHRVGRRAIRNEDGRRAAAVLVVEMAVFFLAFDLLLTPRINEFKSPRPVAEQVLARAPDDVGTFPANFAGAYNLYLGRTHLDLLETPDELVAWLSADEPRLVITSQEHFDRYALGAHVREAWRVEEVHRVGHRRIVFVTNYEPAG